jgi:phage portal protein BeeE
LSFLTQEWRADTSFPHDASDERAWSGYTNYATSTGIQVSPELAMQVSCVFHGVRLISELMGMVEFYLEKERPDGGYDLYRDPYLSHFIEEQANPWQTPQEFRETMTARAIVWPVVWRPGRLILTT